MSGDSCWAEELAAAMFETDRYVAQQEEEARQKRDEELDWGEEEDTTEPQVDNKRNQEDKGFLPRGKDVGTIPWRCSTMTAPKGCILSYPTMRFVISPSCPTAKKDPPGEGVPSRYPRSSMMKTPVQFFKQRNPVPSLLDSILGYVSRVFPASQLELYPCGFRCEVCSVCCSSL